LKRKKETHKRDLRKKYERDHAFANGLVKRVKGTPLIYKKEENYKKEGNYKKQENYKKEENYKKDKRKRITQKRPTKETY